MSFWKYQGEEPSAASYDYYAASKVTGVRQPMICPRCKQRGRFASHPVEILQRMPERSRVGGVYCDQCNRLALTDRDSLKGNKIWYCLRCGTCLCGNCQKW